MRKNKKNYLVGAVFAGGALMLGLSALGIYLVIQNQKLQHNLQDLATQSAEPAGARPLRVDTVWQKYTFQQPGVKYVFSLELPKSFELRRMPPKNPPTQTVFFEVFPKSAEGQTDNPPAVMRIEFFPETGQINFASEQNSDWDRLYHGLVVKSFQLINQ